MAGRFVVGCKLGAVEFEIATTPELVELLVFYVVNNEHILAYWTITTLLTEMTFEVDIGSGLSLFELTQRG